MRDLYVNFKCSTGYCWGHIIIIRAYVYVRGYVYKGTTRATGLPYVFLYRGYIVFTNNIIVQYGILLIPYNFKNIY